MQDQWAEFGDAPVKQGAAPVAAGDEWAEFDDARKSKRSRPNGRTRSEPVVDGDTIRLNERNGRLLGVDAFERSQQGRTPFGSLIALGQQATSTMGGFTGPAAAVTPRGRAAYGRDAITIAKGGQDAGQRLIELGLGIPDARYMLPDQRGPYIGAQRDAIASERGAYAGQYQRPSDYRRQGRNAEWTGKILMNADQAAEWERLVRNPTTTPDQVGDWLRTQGHEAENVGNIVRFLSRNPQAEANPAFQQQDATGAPVQAEPRGLFLRSMDALNEGIIDIVATPFELSHAVGKLAGDRLGVDMGDSSPIAAWLRDKWHAMGVGQRDEGSAPRSDLERYGQAFLRGAGSAVLPVGGTLSAGGKLALRPPSIATDASAARSAIRGSLVDAAKDPRTAVALELGSGAGSYIGEEAAHDIAPGNPYAAIAGQVIGGIGGGLSAGATTRRLGTRSSGDHVASADMAEAPAREFDPAAPMIERDGSLFARAADGAEVPIPIDASGHPGVTWVEDHWEALVSLEGGAPSYGPMGTANSLPSKYAEVAERLNYGAGRRMGAPDTAARQVPADDWDAFDDAPDAEVATIEAAPRENSPEPTASAMAMDADTGRAELVGPELEPARTRDRIEASGQTRRLTDPVTDAERLQAAEGVAPDDVLPLRGGPPADTDTQSVAASSEWGDNVPDLAGNIRLDKLESPQEIDRALTTSVQRAGGFDAATRGRIRNEETASLAADLGMTADDLLARRKGQAFNAEQALAARQILARSGNELVNLAKRVKGVEEPGDELLAAFRRAWVRHVAIQEQVSGMTAEAGRTLQQFRMMADSRLAQGRVLAAAVDGAGGPDRLKEAAEVILDSAGDPTRLNTVTARAMQPRFRDKLIELWYNSLLSGPQTHAVNVMSNTITSLAQIPEHAVAAGLGAFRRAGPSRGADRVLFSELGARSVGLLNGTIEGLRQAARTMRTGETSDAVTKVENQNQHAISGVKGSIIRTPTRALAAEDELFKAIARRMEMHGLAIRQSAAEGLRGDAARQRAAELIANPTDDMIQRSFEYGRYLTFQRPLGPVGQSVSRITADMPVLKLVLPFVRTPTNLLKFTLERSPAAPLLKEWRADFKAGGARRDLAVARAMVGSGIGATIAQLASEGFITGGGPADEDARALLQADGWQPYSIRIGDKYYSYQRLDPLASTMGIAADMVDLQSHMTDKQREEVATLVGIATIKNLSSKTWLSGMTDLVEAIEDPDRNLRNFLARMAGSIAVPAGIAQLARVSDPVLREAREPLDRIRSRIPGLSQSLPPRRDVVGREMRSGGGLGPDIVSPIWTSTRENNPALNALLEAGIGISKPQRKIDDPKNKGKRIELTPEQYDSYQMLTGEIARPQIHELTRSREWDRMPFSDRQEAVRKLMTRARREARSTLMLGEGPRPAPKPLPPGVAGLPDPWMEFGDERR